MDTFTCSVCKKEAPLSEKLYQKGKCKQCRQQYTQAYYLAHAEKQKAYNKKWISKKNLEDPTYIHKRKCAWLDKKTAEDPDYHKNIKIKSCLRYRLKSRFGLTVEQYDEMFAIQQGVCAICKGAEIRTRPRTNGVHNQRLSVDHDHATGKVRALLCANCNAALGHVNDSIPTLQAAIKYLEEHA